MMECGADFLHLDVVDGHVRDCIEARAVGETHGRSRSQSVHVLPGGHRQCWKPHQGDQRERHEGGPGHKAWGYSRGVGIVVWTDGSGHDCGAWLWRPEVHGGHDGQGELAEESVSLWTLWTEEWVLLPSISVLRRVLT